jgi:hypothetical protein
MPKVLNQTRLGLVLGVFYESFLFSIYYFLMLADQV